MSAIWCWPQELGQPEIFIALGHLRQDPQGLRADPSYGEFDADHVVLGPAPDAVDAVFQAIDPEVLRILLPRLEAGDHGLQVPDLRFRCLA